MKLFKGLKVKHKFRDQVTTVQSWNEIGINPTNGITEIFHGNYKPANIWQYLKMALNQYSGQIKRNESPKVAPLGNIPHGTYANGIVL